MEKNNIKFILVENEGVQLGILQKIVERIYKSSPFFIATTAQKALELIKVHGNNSIIISNLTLPDYNGIKLLEQIKELKLNNCLFILSMKEDNDQIKIKALQEGVSDFILKPYSFENLIPKMRNSYMLIESQFKVEFFEQKFVDLKNSFDTEILKLKEILDYIIIKRIPDAEEEILLIENATKWLLQKLLTKNDIEDKLAIELASKLVKTGRIILDDKTINEPVMTDGRLTSQDMTLIPETNHVIYSKIKGYEVVSNILKHQYENFDGTGFPEGQKAWEIPLGSRILRVVSDYYDIMKKEKNSDVTMDKIVNEVKRLYDFNVVAYFDQYLAEINKDGSKLEVPKELKELTEGMTLSRNILTKVGFVLLGRGTQLTNENLGKLIEANSKDGIVGSPYVFDIATKEERTKVE